MPREHEAGAGAGTGKGVSSTRAGTESVIKLVMWISHVRKRANKLTEERRAALNSLGMERAVGASRRNAP